MTGADFKSSNLADEIGYPDGLPRYAIAETDIGCALPGVPGSTQGEMHAQYRPAVRQDAS